MALAVLGAQTVGHSLAGILGWIAFEFSDKEIMMEYELKLISMS